MKTRKPAVGSKTQIHAKKAAQARGKKKDNDYKSLADEDWDRIEARAEAFWTAHWEDKERNSELKLKKLCLKPEDPQEAKKQHKKPGPPSKSGAAVA